MELPDFDSPETRKHLGPSAITAFFKMAELWRLSDDARQLLGAPDAESKLLQAQQMSFRTQSKDPTPRSIHLAERNCQSMPSVCHNAIGLGLRSDSYSVSLLHQRNSKRTVLDHAGK
jgi:hypothetical protein